MVRNRRTYHHVRPSGKGVGRHHPAAVAAAERHFPAPSHEWLVTGGGRHNPALMEALRRLLEVSVRPVEAVGWDGDALEAQAFAYLAVRSVLGLPLSLPATTGALLSALALGQFGRAGDVGRRARRRLVAHLDDAGARDHQAPQRGPLGDDLGVGGGMPLPG